MATSPVLYVEDEENDVLFVRMGLERAGLHHPLQVATNGKQAIDYLAGNGHFANREQYPLPSLVLLDLNLPIRSGFEVLQWLRQQPQFQSLPVVVFTASSQESDREKARQMGANAFITKPANMFNLQELLKRIESHWLVEHSSQRHQA